MAQRIKVSPEQVHQVADQFKQASQQTQEVMDRLQRTMSSMQSEWEGMAQNRFYAEYEQWRTSMNQFAELLSGISHQLHAIARNFEAADQV